MILLIFMFLAAVVPASASTPPETLPEWFIPLRDAIYEQQLNAEQVASIYRDVTQMANSSLSGHDLNLMLSRAEYMMGRALQFEGQNREAGERYDQGIIFAERALAISESSEAWQMLAENISQNCVVKSTAYAMSNGLRVERHSRSALEINPRNATARFLIAARWAYAPSPFHNYNRALQMLKAIPEETDPQKDDLFNIYSSIGYTYMQQRNNAQARIWFEKSLEIYPTNRYIQELLEGLR